MNDQCAQKNIVTLACVSNSLIKHRLILLSLCVELLPVPKEVAMISGDNASKENVNG